MPALALLVAVHSQTLFFCPHESLQLIELGDRWWGLYWRGLRELLPDLLHPANHRSK